MLLITLLCWVCGVVCGSDPLAQFPRSGKGIEELKEGILFDLNQKVEAYGKQKELTYEGVVLGWSRLIEKPFWQGTILRFYGLTTADPVLIERADLAADAISAGLERVMRDSKAIGVVLSYAEKANGLSPQQRDGLNQLLQGIPKKKAAKLRALLSKKEMGLFTTLKGRAEPKNLSGKSCSILNWNICCFDEGASMLFGGVVPWQERIDRIAQKIREKNVDIVCLQEVFSRDAGKKLYEKLKHDYAYFYVDIGPKVVGFDLKPLGVSSGLFVASKLPLKAPRFYPYSEKQTPSSRAYGFFSAEIVDGDASVARLITTHLQPGDSPEDRGYRQAQLGAILASNDDRLPTFVCGDLNIERGSDEYNRQLKPKFFGSQVDDWTACELRDYWWKAGEDIEAFMKLNVPREALDYFLQIKGEQRDRSPSFKTSVWMLMSPEKPREALSDHQPLVSVVDFK